MQTNLVNGSFLSGEWKSVHSVLAVLAISFLALLQGYHAGGGDLSTYIPFLLHYANPDLFSKDLLIQTLDAHPVYIWKFLALFIPVMRQDALLAVAWVFQTILITSAFTIFYQAFFKNKLGLVLFLLILVMGHPAAAMSRFGLNPYNYFHPHVIGLALLLISYVLFSKKKYAIGAIVGGFIFMVHPYSAVMSALVLAWRGLFIWIAEKSERMMLLRSSGIFILFSLPVLIPFLLFKLNQQPVDFNPEVWFEFVRQRMGHSFFISQWYTERWLILLLLSGAIGLFFRQHPAFPSLFPIVLAVLTALFVMWMGDLFSVGFILQLQLGRLNYLIPVVLIAFLSSYVAENHKRLLLAGIICGFLVIYAAEQVWSDLPTLVAGLFLLAILTIILIGILKKTVPIFFTIILIIPVTFVMPVLNIQNHGNVFTKINDADWVDIQKKSREMVPENEVIMSPFYREGFRIYSHRSIFASFKDGAPHNYSKQTFTLWLQRMRELGIPLRYDKKAFPELYHKNAVRVARNEQIKYVVLEKQWAVNVEGEIYANNSYSLLKLP